MRRTSSEMAAVSDREEWSCSPATALSPSSLKEVMGRRGRRRCKEIKLVYIFFKVSKRFHKILSNCATYNSQISVGEKSTRTHLSTQCAAVRTHLSEMRAPPQKGLELLRGARATCHGYSLRPALRPPTIR